MEDMRHLQLSKSDSMLVITSAGDNALHYAINAQPKIVCLVPQSRTTQYWLNFSRRSTVLIWTLGQYRLVVSDNVIRRYWFWFYSQGHLLELKLAAIQSLSYEDFFALFGKGQHLKFRELLDSKISPLLSSIAYQFWRINDQAFSSSFYLHGYSGWALRLASFIFKLAGVSSHVQKFCDADSISEQEEIWQQKLRPVLLNPVVVALLKSPIFCWNALGVPLNQRKMLLDEGSFYEFVRDTLEPVASTWSLKNGAYFYLLVSNEWYTSECSLKSWFQCLLGHYTPSSCPDYLTRRGFNALKYNHAGAMDAFRLHTDSIIKSVKIAITVSH